MWRFTRVLNYSLNILLLSKWYNKISYWYWKSKLFNIRSLHKMPFLPWFADEDDLYLTLPNSRSTEHPDWVEPCDTLIWNNPDRSLTTQPVRADLVTDPREASLTSWVCFFPIFPIMKLPKSANIGVYNIDSSLSQVAYINLSEATREHSKILLL